MVKVLSCCDRAEYLRWFNNIKMETDTGRNWIYRGYRSLMKDSSYSLLLKPSWSDYIFIALVEI